MENPVFKNLRFLFSEGSAYTLLQSFDGALPLCLCLLVFYILVNLCQQSIQTQMVSCLLITFVRCSLPVG